MFKFTNKVKVYMARLAIVLFSLPYLLTATANAGGGWLLQSTSPVEKLMEVWPASYIVVGNDESSIDGTWGGWHPKWKWTTPPLKLNVDQSYRYKMNIKLSFSSVEYVEDDNNWVGIQVDYNNAPIVYEAGVDCLYNIPPVRKIVPWHSLIVYGYQKHMSHDYYFTAPAHVEYPNGFHLVFYIEFKREDESSSQKGCWSYYYYWTDNLFDGTAAMPAINSYLLN